MKHRRGLFFNDLLILCDLQQNVYAANYERHTHEKKYFVDL